jgi:hypothetical protein
MWPCYTYFSPGRLVFFMLVKFLTLVCIMFTWHYW